MSELTLNVETRDKVGTQAVKKMRTEGKIPGIYYIHGSKNIPFLVDRSELHSIWGQETRLIDVIFDEKNHQKCVIRDIQFDPLKGNPIHIDLMGIKMTEKVKMSVPIVLIGTSMGVKNNGGILQQVLRDIEIECLPSDIPDQVDLDVSELEIGDSLHVSDLVIEKAEIQTEESRVVATVTAPRIIAEPVVEEEEEGIEEEGAEPEVLSQKSEDEEEKEE